MKQGNIEGKDPITIEGKDPIFYESKQQAQTAVEWFANAIKGLDTGVSYHFFQEMLEKAKEMEKQQGYSEDDLQTAFQLGRTYEYSNHESTNQLEIVQYLDSLKKAKKYE
jgi:phage shock protein A